MCNPASMLVTNGPIARWSLNTDSHTEMRTEYGLREEIPRGVILAVAVEITPPNNDFNSPADQWVFRVDQDLLPDWWDAAAAEAEVRRVLPEWIAARVCLRGESKEIKSGRLIVADGGRVVARGSSRVEAWGSSRVEAWGSSSVVAWGSSRVVAWGSSRVEAWDSSSVVARDSSSVVARGSSSVEAWDSSSVIRWSARSTVTLQTGTKAAMIDRSLYQPVCSVAPLA